jgi:hypothetical protein
MDGEGGMGCGEFHCFVKNGILFCLLELVNEILLYDSSAGFVYSLFYDIKRDVTTMFRFFMLLRWWFAHDCGGLAGDCGSSSMLLNVLFA